MSLAAGAPASSKRGLLADDVPWRTTSGSKSPVPLIHQCPVRRVPQNPSSAYALQVMKHPNPVREGFGTEARLDAAGPSVLCQVWPIDVSLKFMEPVGKQMTSIGKFMDSTSNVISASTIEDQ